MSAEIPQARQVPQGRRVGVDSLETFEALLAAGAASMTGWRIQDLDLRHRGPSLRGLDPQGSLFLGCDVTAEDAEWLQSRGALLFPDVPGVPVNAYRTSVYTATELYAGLDDGYERTLDARVYAWSRRTAARDTSAALAQALHDHAVDAALGTLCRGRAVVGVMGGHALPRGSQEYADAALLGRELTRSGLLVATGGGPGAMEAANLGACAAGLTSDGVLDLCRRVAEVPDFRPSVTGWARAAFEVLTEVPSPRPSLGIPTWFYGHEPPGIFATHVAKFFRNALREALLLEVCDAGIVFLPGAAGTVQEVFQDACENYYADDARRAPMVLVDRRHWTETLPAWPLLEALAARQGFRHRVALVDSVAEVPDALARTGR